MHIVNTNKLSYCSLQGRTLKFSPYVAKAAAELGKIIFKFINFYNSYMNKQEKSLQIQMFPLKLKMTETSSRVSQLYISNKVYNSFLMSFLILETAGEKLKATKCIHHLSNIWIDRDFF